MDQNELKFPEGTYFIREIVRYADQDKTVRRREVALCESIKGFRYRERLYALADYDSHEPPYGLKAHADLEITDDTFRPGGSTFVEGCRTAECDVHEGHVYRRLPTRTDLLSLTDAFLKFGRETKRFSVEERASTGLLLARLLDETE